MNAKFVCDPTGWGSKNYNAVVLSKKAPTSWGKNYSHYLFNFSRNNEGRWEGWNKFEGTGKLFESTNGGGVTPST